MEGIDLQDSFILDWSVSEGEFIVELEASIWPSSAHYASPLPNEYTCYKKANLVFKSFSSISGLLSQRNVNSSGDPNGSIDYGNIDSLVETDSGFEIYASFGNVIITGGELDFSVCT